MSYWASSTNAADEDQAARTPAQRVEESLAAFRMEATTTQTMLEQILGKLLKIEATQEDILSRLDGRDDQSVCGASMTPLSSPRTVSFHPRGFGGPAPAEVSDSQATASLRRLSNEERKLVLSFRNRNGSNASLDSPLSEGPPTVSDKGGIAVSISPSDTRLRDEQIERTSKLAEDELCAIVGYPRSNEMHTKKKWELVRSGHNCHIWLSTTKNEGVYIKGGTFASALAKNIATWLFEENYFTAVHGITHQIEVLASVGRSTVRRITCVKSGIVMSSKRELIVVTTQTEVEGAIVIATRSLLDDSLYPLTKGYSRGFLHSSGFVIRPVKSSDMTGSEIQFAVHVDFKTSSSRSSASRVDPIVKSLVSLTESIRTGHSTKLIDNSLALKRGTIPLSQQLSPEERSQLKDVSTNAVANLRTLHESERTVWTSFYDADDIDVSECSGGVLRASCAVNATPATIRRLLLDNAEAIDGLLEKKYVLSQLDSGTIVQLLAYGPIWPVGARDYLVVTSEVDYETSLGNGFVIASTSIDDICEEEDECGLASKYARSGMRLAGYIGIPNAAGGTDLRMFVDVDVYSYVPEMLVHMLAQYGLSEMMNRIRLVSVGQRVSVKPFQLDRIVSKLKEKGVDTAKKMQRRVSQILLHEERRKSLVEGSIAQHVIAEGHVLASDKAVEEEEGSGDDDDDFVSLTDDEECAPSSSPPAALSASEDAKGLSLALEASRLYRVYLAGANDAGQQLEWVEKVNRKGVVVHSAVVGGSTWMAIRATTTINCDAATVLHFLLDDSKVGSYDDMFDSCDVSSSCFSFLVDLTSVFCVPCSSFLESMSALLFVA